MVLDLVTFMRLSEYQAEARPPRGERLHPWYETAGSVDPEAIKNLDKILATPIPPRPGTGKSGPGSGPPGT